MTELETLTLAVSLHELHIQKIAEGLKQMSEGGLALGELARRQAENFNLLIARVEMLEEKVNLLQRQLRGDGSGRTDHAL